MPSTILRSEQPNTHDSAGSNSSNSSYKPRQIIKVSNSASPSIGHTLSNMQLPPDEEVDDRLLAAGLPQSKQLSAAPADQAKEESQAVALLHHMHLAQHQIHAPAAADDMDIDHDHQHAAARSRDEARNIQANHGNDILQPAAAAAHGAGENSQTGSSDASAAYFSGDSDLTAEPIMGCAADDDELAGSAARSSNSGSSSTPGLPVKPKSYLASPNIEPGTQGPFPVGLIGAQAYSRVNVLPVHEGERTCRSDHEEMGHSSQKAATATLVASRASTSSTTAPWRSCNTPALDSDTAEVIRRKHAQEHQIDSRRQLRSTGPSLEYADSESWLELRLGSSSHDQTPRGLQQYIGAEVRNLYGVSCEGGQRKWSKESDQGSDDAASTDDQQKQPVTLQLLPEGRLNFTDQKSCGEAANLRHAVNVRPPLQEATVAAAINSVSLSYPSSNTAHVYHPSSSSTSSLLHSAGPHVDMQLTPALLHASGAQPCGHSVLSANRSGCQPGAQYSDQVFHITQRSTQTYNIRQPMALSTRPIYDATRNVLQEHNLQQDGPQYDQRRWVSSEGLDVTLLAGPAASSTASIALEKSEIYRPTASLAGWAPGTSALNVSDIQMEPGLIRPTVNNWSAGNSVLSYVTPAAQAQLQNGMSWQGLLRSMATDPLLHAHTLMREASMHHTNISSFNNGSATISQPHAGIMRRRHNDMQYPSPACATPASAISTAAGHRAHAPTSFTQPRLRLASSRCRSTDLWFSLQEARHFSDEKSQDQLSDHPVQKLYLRIRDGKMQISVVKSYLVKKLGSGGSIQYNADEVEITCRGQVLSPTLTMQHVRDSIWFNQDVEVEAIGFQYKPDQNISSIQNRVMALCYQKLHTHTVTLNLLKL